MPTKGIVAKPLLRLKDAAMDNDGPAIVGVLARKRWWLPSMAFALTWAVIGAFPSRIYMGSDDATIAAIVNGTMSGTPDAHGIFISTALGSMMAALSSLFPSIGWYGVVVWTILASGVAGAALAIVALVPQWQLRVFPALALGSGVAPLLHQLSFTTTAIVVGGVSFLLLFSATRAESVSESRYLLTWSICSAIASIALRDEGFGAAALVLAPIAVAATVANWRLALLFLGAVFVAFSLFSTIDSAAYSAPEWNNFLEFRRARSEIVDYAQPEPKEGLEAADWSGNDLAMYRNYSFFDQEVHGTSRSVAYAKATSTTPPSLDLKPRISEGRFWLILSALVVLAALIPGRMPNYPQSSLGLGVFMAIWTGATSSAVGIWRFQWRVFDGMSTVGLFTALLLVVMTWRAPRQSRPTRIAALALLIVLIPAGLWHVSNRTTNLRATAPSTTTFNQTVDRFLALDDDIVFVGEANAIPIAVVDPLTRSDIWDSLAYQTSGWQTFSPVWWERSRNLGLQDLPLSLVGNDKIVYLTYYNGSEARMERFLLEHYGISTIPCEVTVVGYQIRAWQFVTESTGCT